MDPLTHTLLGASLAASRLGAKTRLAVPALVIGANLPDLDVVAYTRGSDFALGFRRGWTHGVAAVVVLPVLLATVLWLWDRWRSSDDSDPPLATGWLFGLSYLAVATHPTLDWLNTYGMRWLMPFRDTWYYGDSVFIVDPWLWLILGAGWLLGRRPAPAVGVVSTVIVASLILMVAKRAPTYLPPISIVLIVLLTALLWTPRSPSLTGARSATFGLMMAGLYIAIMIGLHAVTERRVRHELDLAGVTPFDQLMIGPRPANPLAWDVVVRQDRSIRHGRFHWHGERELQLAASELRSARGTALWQEIEATGQEPGFVRWVRLPWYDIEVDAAQRRVWVMDARYARRRRSGFGTAEFELPTAAAE